MATPGNTLKDYMPSVRRLRQSLFFIDGILLLRISHPFLADGWPRGFSATRILLGLCIGCKRDLHYLGIV